ESFMPFEKLKPFGLFVEDDVGEHRCGQNKQARRDFCKLRAPSVEGDNKTYRLYLNECEREPEPVATKYATAFAMVSFRAYAHAEESISPAHHRHEHEADEQ